MVEMMAIQPAGLASSRLLTADAPSSHCSDSLKERIKYTIPYLIPDVMQSGSNTHGFFKAPSARHERNLQKSRSVTNGWGN